jgi:uncharacterized lipoprotein NlpE involved in copper resistance
MMKTNILGLTALAVMLALTGCNKAESPDKVAKDVSNATATAEKNDERAQEKDVKADAAAQNDINNGLDKAATKEASAAADDAITQAEGENKIARAKCEALSGDAQKNCKDEADARLDQVKQRAKAMKSDHS